MEPNNLCCSLIVYGFHAPGGEKHHVFSELPGEWLKGKVPAVSLDPTMNASVQAAYTEAWLIHFSDCNAKMFTPEWEQQKALLHNRWQELDCKLGAGWARNSIRWWPFESVPEVGKNGMLAVNIYLPLEKFPHLSAAALSHKPYGQKILDIWVGFIQEERQGQYFEENYNDDDDSPISAFANDQGEVWIDHDFMEVGFKSKPKDVKNLVQGHSWSDKYAKALAERVAAKNINGFNTFVLLDVEQVKSPCSVHKEGIELHYLGQFTIIV